MSRREAAKRVGLATMIALPLITSLVAPMAANAQSSAACPCPSTEPTTCIESGSYSIGCYTAIQDCYRAGDASGGSSAAPNHCCYGGRGGGGVYNFATGCCTVICQTASL